MLFIPDDGRCSLFSDAFDLRVTLGREAFQVASQLGSLGSKKGFRVLVDGLSDERVEMRFKCFEALQELTGNTFGYSHTAAPEVRKVAVDEWEAWLVRVESEEF